MTALEPGQLWLMRIQALAVGVVALIPATVAGLVLDDLWGFPGWLPFVPALIVLFGIVWGVGIAPARRFASWGYDEAEDAIEVAHGIWSQIATVVPYGRVQHIDVIQGPLERMFGVSRLVLHTAGTAHSMVVLPGLARAQADAMRERIRGHIRREPE